MQSQITDLQIKIAYLEDMLAALNQSLVQLQQDNLTFAKQLHLLKTQQQAQASLLADLRDETLPPHY